MSFVLLILGILTTVASSSSLIERKMFDPFIVCHNPPPPTYALPPGYLSRDYQTSMDLCSAANGKPRHNVGCFCSTSKGELHCDSDLWDPTLALATTDWFNRTNDHAASFEEFCEIACYCSDVSSAALARGSRQRNSALNRILNYDNATDTFIGRIEPDNTEVVADNQCGTSCSSHLDCTGGQNECLCKTQSEKYVPGKGMVMFAASCMLSIGGKREEQAPCPCNGTYVSNGCCAAIDGIVYEAEHLKLGEMLSSEAL